MNATGDGHGGVRSETQVIRKEARRVYVYSDADDVIWSKDVETHAKLAESKGFDVRREKWTGSLHVGHMRADPERYWDVVWRAWKDGLDTN